MRVLGQIILDSNHWFRDYNRRILVIVIMVIMVVINIIMVMRE